ncbi:hypothetical protein [Marinobacter halophilus]|uniref:Uncharacterized protein n=1 Tax=Marinobacter halophilus TaxID=1323740 RepID=A0A2T1KCC6_9GAMM|nr:hypothetical protein [Marinobacter halophilus]PSF07781.1 hypothetical protein C7H08_10225 [Marinobacter halophilus]GGC56991.1 hypothetical protein GCM10011362_01710 [Marinobacter halophilus]
MKTKASQRGALIFATPLLLALVFIFGTLMIDGARLLLLQSEMQSIVNSASTAAADEAQACGGIDPGWNKMLQRTLLAAEAAGFDGDPEALDIVPGVLRPGAAANTPMRFSSRDATTQMAQTNAVMVRYTREEPVSFLLPTSVFPPITISADAVARKEVYATLSAAGSTANVEGGLLGSLVGELIGVPGYSLNATDLQSLENTLVSLGDLLAGLGVDRLTDLVDEPLLDVLSSVAILAGGTASPAGRLVDDLSSAVGLSGLNASAVFDVLGEPPGSTDANIPVYDFAVSVILNSVRALNQSGAGLLSLTLDTSQSTVLSDLVGSNDLLGDIDLTLKLLVDEPPKIVIGPARKDSNDQWLTTLRAADVSVDASADLQLATGVIGDLVSTLSLGLVKVDVLDSIRIPLGVQVGGGRAGLVGANCAAGSDNRTQFDLLLQTNVSNIETGSIDGATGQIVPDSIHASILRLRDLLNIVNVDVCVAADLDVEVSSAPTVEQLQSYNLYCPGGQCEIQEMVAGSGVDNADINLHNLSLLNCNSGGSTSDIDAVLAGLVSPLTALLELVAEQTLGNVLAPLLSALGADLGGMHVRVLGAEQTGSQLVENVVFE